MAQPQVVNIQAMYQIGRAAEWRPDETPKFMGWVEKAVGAFAVDLLHDAWDTKKSYLKQNSLNAQGVEDIQDEHEIAESMQLQIDDLLSNGKDIVAQNDLRAAFYDPEDISKDAIKSVQKMTKNLEKSTLLYETTKANNLVLLEDKGNNIGAHTPAYATSFSYIHGNGDLDNFMRINENGEWYLSSDEVTMAINKLNNELYSLQDMEGSYASDPTNPKYKTLVKEIEKYSNILLHSMGNEDLNVTDFPVANIDESNAVHTEILDRKKSVRINANNSKDGVFDGTQNEKDSREYWSTTLNGKSNNEIQSTWFAQIDSKTPSPAHNYITQEGGYYLGGVLQPAAADPFAENADQTDADKDGVADVMQKYLGAMEMLKEENLAGGNYTEFLENYMVGMDRDTFKYTVSQKEPKTPLTTGEIVSLPWGDFNVDNITEKQQSQLTLVQQLINLNENIKIGNDIYTLQKNGNYRLTQEWDGKNLVDVDSKKELTRQFILQTEGGKYGDAPKDFDWGGLRAKERERTESPSDWSIGGAEGSLFENPTTGQQYIVIGGEYVEYDPLNPKHKIKK